MKPENTRLEKEKRLQTTNFFLDSMSVFGAEKIRTEFLGRSSPHLDKPVDFQSDFPMPPGVYFKMGCNHGVLAQVCVFSKLEV